MLGERLHKVFGLIGLELVAIATYSSHRLKMGKSLKMFFSETMKPTAYKHVFDLKQCLVVPYINHANQAPEVQTGPTPGIKGFHRLTIGKPLKIFSETIRPTAYKLVKIS